MIYLLDTHTVLWFLGGHKALGPKTRTLIEKSYYQVVVSYASVWETAIKQSSGKLTLKRPLDVQAQDAGFQLLGIELPHIQATLTLPAIHRDPFDRLLIAQSLVEGCTLITSDANIWKYPKVRLIDARK